MAQSAEVAAVLSELGERRPMIRCIGHRGGAALAPENSLAAFRAGIAAGADAVECDVHRTRDGHLILMHDADVSRTTDGRGHIGAMTLAELEGLNCAVHFGDGAFAPQRIPTLAELLAITQRHVAVQVEIKVPDGKAYGGIESQVVTAFRDSAVTDTAQVISFDAPTLTRTRALAPNLSLGFLASHSSLPSDLQDDPAHLARYARACGANFLGLERQFLTAAHIIAAAHEGLGVAVWTVNDRRDIERFARLGVFSITSDRPDLLRQVLDAQVT
ncbi:MAG: glycerophosphodiester phosphodiesterase [Chloroflexota bacterium]